MINFIKVATWYIPYFSGLMSGYLFVGTGQKWGISFNTDIEYIVGKTPEILLNREWAFNTSMGFEPTKYGMFWLLVEEGLCLLRCRNRSWLWIPKFHIVHFKLWPLFGYNSHSGEKCHCKQRYR